MTSDLWLAFDRLSYLDLAYLCSNLEPQPASEPVPYTVWKMLNTIFQHFGVYAAYYGREPPDWLEVAKIETFHPHEARQFALSRGIRPARLFPEDCPDSDTALGRDARERFREFACKSAAGARCARELVWRRWQEAAASIQSESKEPLSKRELAQRVKQALGLSDSLDTIRKRL